MKEPGSKTGVGRELGAPGMDAPADEQPVVIVVALGAPARGLAAAIGRLQRSPPNPLVSL